VPPFFDGEAMRVKLFVVVLGVLSLWSAVVAAKPLDNIIAVVNDDVITELELGDELDMIKKQLSLQNTRLPPDDILKPQILERMILRRLQLQLADKIHLHVDDETLNRTLDNIAAQNGMSLTQFRETLGREGIDFARFRENMRNEITISRLQNQRVSNRITVTQQEIDNFLANQALLSESASEYHIGHILVSVPEAANAEAIAKARAKAEALVKRVRSGEDFEQVAIAESDGQQALKGGDLGWRQSAALPSLFAEWINQSREGQVSDPIRSPSGFHIITLHGKRSAEKPHLVTQTHVRHILIRGSELVSEDEVKQRLNGLKERIEAGEDFAALAKAHSEDPGSAVEGGDLGWVNPGEMVPRFEEAMNTLQKGQISDVVRSRFGWHLIQVLDRRSHDNTELVQRNKARDVIRNRKTEPALENWLRKLRDEAFVEVRLKQ
jgi:peptidyl-prolyl cis-trans isomerase SurA